MAVARGRLRVARNKPKVWFTSTESFAKVLSAGNRDLLRVIVEQEPGSLDELARITCSFFYSDYDAGSVQGFKTGTRARE
jgi:predicted transcriptional regulator